MAKDAVLAAAATVTAIVAVRGLRKWHQEMNGKADFDAARALGRATFKLRDEINACRSPLIRSTEYPSGHDFSDQRNTPENKAMATAHAFNGRWTRVQSALQDFETQNLEAEALWGAEIRTLSQALRSCVNTIYGSMEAIIDDARAGGENFKSDRDFGIRMRSNAFGSPDDDKNKLSREIKAAVEAIEKRMREKLSRH
jgi:hypothetical protein